MKRIAAWFDEHPKTRIVLQLMVDAASVLAALMHFLSFCTVTMLEESGAYHMQPSAFYRATLVCLMIIPIPAFVASFLWRDRAFALFEQHRWCRWTSTALRIISALVVAFSFLMDIVLLALWISVK